METNGQIAIDKQLHRLVFNLNLTLRQNKFHFSAADSLRGFIYTHVFGHRDMDTRGSQANLAFIKTDVANEFSIYCQKYIESATEE